MKIGVLALQGSYAAHQGHLEQLGIDHCQVRKPDQLAGLSGLIIPGGESSTLLKLMAPFDWLSALRAFAAEGNVIFGTCAGMIMLASQVLPSQASLALIDIDVERNAYGRQAESFIADSDELPACLDGTKAELVFIRAPKIVRCGAEVRVLVNYQGQPVMVQQGNIIAASFHPELSADVSLHRYIAQYCRQKEGQALGGSCLS